MTAVCLGPSRKIIAKSATKPSATGMDIQLDFMPKYSSKNQVCLSSYPFKYDKVTLNLFDPCGLTFTLKSIQWDCVIHMLKIRLVQMVVLE